MLSSAAMMMSNIPEEMVEEILCRVPAISLKRLRSTCKQWNRIFEDRIFSRKHFDKAAKQFPLVVITNNRDFCSLINLHINGIPYAEVTGELSINQVKIYEVFHCDGLLLCTTIEANSRLVVWNPCTGQTKWIQTDEIRGYNEIGRTFVLGSYQDNKSYKILSYTAYHCGSQTFDIYDINSKSWRNLDVPPIPDRMCSESRVSLKGKTYWFVWDSGSWNFPVGLIRFDYTTESFERLHLPKQCNINGKYSLLVVGEEKLSIVLQHTNSSRKEVWITKKIDDETKEMSWSKLLELEVGIRRTSLCGIWSGRRFLVDEVKKIVVWVEEVKKSDVCCERGRYDELEPVITVGIVGADSNATRGLIRVKTKPLSWPFVIDYVPSLIQIQ